MLPVVMVLFVALLFALGFADSSGQETAAYVLSFVFIALLGSVPGIVASLRKHPHVVAIWAIALLASGWMALEAFYGDADGADSGRLGLACRVGVGVHRPPTDRCEGRRPATHSRRPPPDEGPSNPVDTARRRRTVATPVHESRIATRRSRTRHP